MTTDPLTAIGLASVEALTQEQPARFHCEPRQPLSGDLARILAWVYEHEHRGERISEELGEIVNRLEYRAWCRGNDHLPIDENEAS